MQQLARGYTDTQGRTVVLTEDDLANLPIPSIKTVDVVAFVDATSVDPLQLSRSYFLGFYTSAAKPYVLLRDAMREAGRVAITKVTMRTGAKEQLALLRVRDDVLVLQTMNWPDEVRSTEGLAPAADVTVRPQEVQMATSLMDALSADFDLAALRDRYRDAMTELVTAKLEGEALPDTAAVTPAPGDVVDLMAALPASIDAHQHEQPSEEEHPERQPRCSCGPPEPEMRRADDGSLATRSPLRSPMPQPHGGRTQPSSTRCSPQPGSVSSTWNS
ncbi:Ku protein [Streptomyces sp. NPDC005722]